MCRLSGRGGSISPQAFSSLWGSLAFFRWHMLKWIIIDPIKFQNQFFFSKPRTFRGKMHHSGMFGPFFARKYFFWRFRDVFSIFLFFSWRPVFFLFQLIFFASPPVERSSHYWFSSPCPRVDVPLITDPSLHGHSSIRPRAFPWGEFSRILWRFQQRKFPWFFRAALGWSVFNYSFRKVLYCKWMEATV